MSKRRGRKCPLQLQLCLTFGEGEPRKSPGKGIAIRKPGVEKTGGGKGKEGHSFVKSAPLVWQKPSNIEPNKKKNNRKWGKSEWNGKSTGSREDDGTNHQKGERGPWGKGKPSSGIEQGGESTA